MFTLRQSLRGAIPGVLQTLPPVAHRAVAAVEVHGERRRRAVAARVPLADPVHEREEEPKRDVTANICQAMKDWKDYLNGDESKMLSWEEFLNAVQD